MAWSRGHLACAVLALLGLVTGCATPPEERAAAPRSDAAGTDELYDLPCMQRAKASRGAGCQEMEAAYSVQDSQLRERHLQRAFDHFDEAQAAYHEALTVALPRYRPVVDRNIDEVDHYMRQIRTDRATRTGDSPPATASATTGGR